MDGGPIRVQGMEEVTRRPKRGNNVAGVGWEGPKVDQGSWLVPELSCCTAYQTADLVSSHKGA